MTKKLVLTALIALLVLAVLFAGCESYRNPVFSMGDKDAVVESNGGLAVKQGDYLYFVNGYTGYNTTDAQANWFGNVLKGAILRVKEGESMDTAEVIVPKNIMGAYSESGFSIYGDYIYYVSPSVEESKSGAIKTNITQFMRTRLDGQETRVIFESEDSTLTYKYTPYGLVYFLDGKLYCKSYQSKHFVADENGAVIAEDITAVHFPKSLTYDKNVGETLADYIFYTKASEDMYDYSNRLYIINASGSVNELLVDKFSYTNDPVENPSLAFKLEMVNSISEADGLTLYYTKTEFVGTSSSGNVKGLYAYKFDQDLTFDKADEVMLSTGTATKIYPLGISSGAVVYDSEIKIVKDAVAPEVYTGITSVTVAGVVDGYIYYYNSSNKLFRYKLDGSENVAAVMDYAINSTWITPEIIGDYFYYFNTDKKDYLYKIKLSTFDRLDSTKLENTLTGKMLASDAEALAEEEEAD